LSGTIFHALAFKLIFRCWNTATISNPSAIAANYPYTLSAVAKKLGGNYWSIAQAAIDRIRTEKNFDLKASDNKYHIATKYGKSILHKYSDDAVALLKKARKGEAYEI
jgi:hypothetical protein